MKLSIIAPVYRQGKNLRKFLEKISQQKERLFELILVIDTNYEECLAIAEELIPKIKAKVKIIYNSKRIGRKNALKSALKIADGEYIIIMSSSNRFSETAVTSIFSIINSKKTDIIEFQAAFRTPIKFNGRQRQLLSELTNISEKSDVLAYTYSLEFNKIIRTNVAKKAFSMPSIDVSVNSRYEISLLYKILISAKTYSNINVKIIESKSDFSSTFDPLKTIKEFEAVLKYEAFKKYIDHIYYNLYFYSKIIMSALVGATRNKILIKKYMDRINVFMNKYPTFYETNRFLLRNNKETAMLKKYRDKNSTKAYKLLNEKNK